MSNEKFTPGPWIVKKNRAVYAKRYKKLPKDRVYGYGLADNEGFICVLEDEEYHVYADKQECKANASLISAAPEMYETLNDICNDCEKLANWEDLFNVGVEGISVQYPKCPCEDCNIAKVLKEARGEK